MSWISIAAVYGALAVVAGAFGAHGLKSRVSPEQLSAWHTAANYHLIHSAVLLALGIYGQTTGRSVVLPGSLFALGVLLFSGSIYLLVLSPARWLGPVTPVGGTLMIAAWVSLLFVMRGPAQP